MNAISTRADGRKDNELRPVVIRPGVNPYAEGSAEVRFGMTQLLVTATVSEETPRWMAEPAQGWVTAEYGMLPRATHSRNGREAAAGKQGGRTMEIQRLIGRALRAAADLRLLRGLTIKIDRDVIVADGGTRTAAISGGWVALHQAVQWAVARGLTAGPVPLTHIAAVSAGIVRGVPLLDLCYDEDSQADFDLNLVFTGQDGLIEIQGTAERSPLSGSQLQQLITLGWEGAQTILGEQKRALTSFEDRIAQ